MDIESLSPITLRLQQFREQRQISQAELARRSSVPQSTISRIEAGETGSVSLANLERLAQALGINAALLIVHDPEGEEEPVQQFLEKDAPTVESMSAGELKREIEWRSRKFNYRFQEGRPIAVTAVPIAKGAKPIINRSTSFEEALRATLRELRMVPLPKGLRRL